MTAGKLAIHAANGVLVVVFFSVWAVAWVAYGARRLAKVVTRG